MRRPPLHLLLVLAVSGCAVPLGGPGAGGSASPSAALSQPPEPLGGLSFKVLAPENARYAGGVGGAMPASASMPLPAPAMAPASTSPGVRGPVDGGPPAPPEGLSSGNMNGGFGYGYGYGPGLAGGAPSTLVSLTQTETSGSKGPYQQVLAGVIQPIIADWAPDAQLMAVNATTGNDGLLAEASPTPTDLPAGCGPSYASSNDTGWRLTYLSVSRNEMLNFYVTPAKTLVVRARWAPLNLAATAVGVDNDVALRSLVTAIETRGFQGEEEKSGLDYFMGGSFAQNCFGPQPIPMASGAPQQNRTEVIFEVPDNARWNINLQVILGKPVWELSFYAQPDMAPTLPPKGMPLPSGSMPPYEDPGFHFNNSARGLVDATTGAVIRFNRPHKQYYARPMPGGVTSPQPASPPPGQ